MARWKCHKIKSSFKLWVSVCLSLGGGSTTPPPATREGYWGSLRGPTGNLRLIVALNHYTIMATGHTTCRVCWVGPCIDPTVLLPPLHTYNRYGMIVSNFTMTMCLFLSTEGGKCRVVSGKQHYAQVVILWEAGDTMVTTGWGFIWNSKIPGAAFI